MDQPKPDETTGKTMLENVPPVPDPPSVPVAIDSQTADDAVIEATSVQGAPEDE